MVGNVRRREKVYRNNIHCVTPSYLKKLGLKFCSYEAYLIVLKELEEYVEDNIETVLAKSVLSNDNSELNKFIEDNNVDTEYKFKKMASKKIILEILQKNGYKHGYIKSETVELFRSILFHLIKKFVNMKNEE